MKRIWVCFVAGVLACQEPAEHEMPIAETPTAISQNAQVEIEDSLYKSSNMEENVEEDVFDPEDDVFMSTVFSEDMLDLSFLPPEPPNEENVPHFERIDKNEHANGNWHSFQRAPQARHAPFRDCWFCGRETGFLTAPDVSAIEVEHARVRLEWNVVEGADYYTVRALQWRDGRKVASHIWFADEPLFLGHFEPGHDYVFSVIAWRDGRHRKHRSMQSQELRISIPEPSDPQK